MEAVEEFQGSCNVVILKVAEDALDYPTGAPVFGDGCVGGRVGEFVMRIFHFPVEKLERLVLEAELIAPGHVFAQAHFDVVARDETQVSEAADVHGAASVLGLGSSFGLDPVAGEGD